MNEQSHESGEGESRPGPAAISIVASLGTHENWLREQVGRQPDISLRELRERLGERGVSASVSTIWQYMNKHGIAKMNRARKSRIKPHHDWILQCFADDPNVTLAQLRDGLSDRGVTVSREGIRQYLDRAGIERRRLKPRRVKPRN